MAKKRSSSEFDRANELAASIVRADPARYDGLALWAKLWPERHPNVPLPKAVRGERARRARSQSA